ncbi:hypothetical protein NUW54_g6694 [Trametes sanguinea]|uniref:Uncharacterized protein n=1 Tax=Trametes sanguinea TaxID=158606 RepID=A0ACC1PTL4_9APHY|nr:hypothetical protein NUW54_g6694 [Trametes sanguinea]
MLSTGRLADDPKNHCVPILEVLDVPDDPDTQLLGMPLLHAVHQPRFLTGLQFMHAQRVAHRDITLLNVMMDPRPLFPEGFHFASPEKNRDYKVGLFNPKHYSRTGCPTKYYFIDFGLSRSFSPENKAPRSWPIWGGDRTVPEFHKSGKPCDPFPTDIYYLGSLIRMMLLREYVGLEFLGPLVADMVHEEPCKRPTIDEVATRFSALLSTLGWWTLRSRLRNSTELENPILRPFRATAHAFRTGYHILTFRLALPQPVSS